MWLISVIVPFYNAGEFLDHAIKSILNQTYSHFEIVLVDDGSSDGSEFVAEQLARSDQRIRLFKQPNQGVSGARNLALQHAKGDYLMFVDADDWIDLSMISCIVEELNQHQNVDLVRLTSQKVLHRESTIVVNKPYRVNLYDPLSFIKENLLGGQICSLFIKTAIVRDHKLLFSSDMKFMEDQEFSLKCFLHAKRILFYEKPHYFYYQNQRPTSLTHSTNRNRNSDDILKCGLRVYEYASVRVSGEMLSMIRKYSLAKLKQYLRLNLRYTGKSALEIGVETKSYLAAMDISFFNIGRSSMTFYFIIKSGLRSILFK